MLFLKKKLDLSKVLPDVKIKDSEDEHLFSETLFDNLIRVYKIEDKDEFITKEQAKKVGENSLKYMANNNFRTKVLNSARLEGNLEKLAEIVVPGPYESLVLLDDEFWKKILFSVKKDCIFSIIDKNIAYLAIYTQENVKKMRDIIIKVNSNTQFIEKISDKIYMKKQEDFSVEVVDENKVVDEVHEEESFGVLSDRTFSTDNDFDFK